MKFYFFSFIKIFFTYPIHIRRYRFLFKNYILLEFQRDSLIILVNLYFSLKNYNE